MMREQTDFISADIAVANSNLLSHDVNSAVHEMIKISQRLVTLAEQETQSLVQNDLIGFAVLQDEKEQQSKRYVQASQEFRKRINEFRSVDQNLLTRLNRLQSDLAEKTQSNNIIVARIRDKARVKTQSTLFTAQELAQSKIVRFKSDLKKMAQDSQQNSPSE